MNNSWYSVPLRITVSHFLIMSCCALWLPAAPFPLPAPLACYTLSSSQHRALKPLVFGRVGTVTIFMAPAHTHPLPSGCLCLLFSLPTPSARFALPCLLPRLFPGMSLLDLHHAYSQPRHELLPYLPLLSLHCLPASPTRTSNRTFSLPFDLA